MCHDLIEVIHIFSTLNLMNLYDYDPKLHENSRMGLFEARGTDTTHLKNNLSGPKAQEAWRRKEAQLWLKLA